jgi:hypothetical protein
VQAEDVIDAGVRLREHDRAAVDDDTDVADQRLVQHGVRRGAIVGHPSRIPAGRRARGRGQAVVTRR